MDLQKQIQELAKKTRIAASTFAFTSTAVKNTLLTSVAQGLREQKQRIQEENQKDILRAQDKGMSEAMLDRLRLSDSTLESMVEGLETLCKLDDPVGKIDDCVRRPNGLQVGRMRVPLGVVAMIYESRPNVTIDAAALCLKTGNGVILRGGSEAISSNLALAKVLKDSLRKNGIDENVVQVIPTTDRLAVNHLLALEDEIDLVIPRGGEGLIRFVTENSRIPVLKHYKGVCHIYVDKEANLELATPVILNSKTQRPGVCNALEGLLIHGDIAQSYLPKIVAELMDRGVTLYGCELSRAISNTIQPATEKEWGREFLGLELCVKVVKGYEEAVEYIRKYGSQHTEVILTENYTTANRFINEVDASAVMVNASTRFNDGGQLGLGAEIGISTTKLHAYGPMGLEELTTRKFVIYGQGQTRK